MSKPIAVLISDIHYNINTLPVADAALRQAVAMAKDLDVPLVVAGDLHDTKANMRAECMNAIQTTLFRDEIKAYVLVGNHDKVNEKGHLRDNALNFLNRGAVGVIERPVHIYTKDSSKILFWLIPYFSEVTELRKALAGIPKGSTIIMHQGLNGSESGEYIQDKSALDYEDVKEFRVISGHYHRRQDIKTGPPRKGAVGLFSYIGNPYTLGYGEAGDPPKGFRVLMDDGLLEFVPTNLRKHIVYEQSYECLSPLDLDIKEGDLLWVKVTGSKEDLLEVTKPRVAHAIEYHGDFRLDLIPEGTETEVSETKGLNQGEILDSLIDSLTATTDERKERLKQLWRQATCK